MSPARLCLASAALLWTLAHWQQGKLPGPQALSDTVKQEPLQTVTGAQPFHTQVGGVDYRIQPLFDYEISGLVVSLHDADTWWDYAHAEWNDKLNVRDLCLVWGANAKSGAYQAIHFSSGQWTCNFSSKSASDWAAFDIFAASNNHVLVDKAHLAKLLKRLKVGDQVLLRGQLVEYSHQHGTPFQRGSSTRRDDTGNGACETIYLREARVLRAAPAAWGWLKLLAGLLAAAGVWLWWRAPHRVGPK